MPDKDDSYPDNPNEWANTDNDDLGNNADPDDDNDGMSDNFEILVGFDPVIYSLDPNVLQAVDIFPPVELGIAA